MTHADWDALIQKHLDGRTDASEAAALSTLLESDAEALLLYLQLARLHATLATDFAEEPRPAIEPKRRPDRTGDWTRDRRVWIALSVLACVLVVSAVVVMARSRPAAPVARLTAVSGPVQWVGDGGQVESDSLVGREVGAGSLESMSVDSWAVLEYPDGTTVTLTGRTTLALVSGTRKEMRLGHGCISVNAVRQPAGQPVLIRTPTALLEVLGTQLNVGSDSSSTQVSVNEGLVRVTRLVDGTATEVPADHQATATVDRFAELRAVRRSQPVSVWRTLFPAGVNYGYWRVSADGHGGVQAKPLLLTCAKPNPLLIYVASSAVSGKDASPLVLGRDGRFVVRGRLGSTADVVFGMTLNHPKGGFAGKYLAHRTVTVPANEPFEWTVGAVELVPTEPAFPRSPVGLEIVECWCLTLHKDHGLVVESMELKAER